MNRHADWLIEDLESGRNIRRDLAAKADKAGDYKLANIHRVVADTYAVAVAKVTDALPGIIAEAQTPEPDAGIVFGPLATLAHDAVTS